MGRVNRQVEAYPGFAITLETLDIAGAERGGLGAGVEFGGQFQVDIGEPGVFIKAIDGLVGGHARAAEQ
ncbi:hypothetical protein D9M72_625590 [compost metagenome]